ncbi:MAG: pseudaminic acid synthase [Pseudomonadales bacterium]|nr:pseudaminic acid synthase [Pseudomonadales bacterium]
MTQALSEVRIASRRVSDQEDPFIIAEFSGNHAQDLAIAEEMVRAAARAGVDAIKLQTYTADTITLDGKSREFQIRDDSSLWKGETLHSLYKKACTPWAWHSQLFSLARENGLIAFSSPFDETSVELLESLDVPCYKIASFELNHFPLLKAVARTGKPIIMSTGMATLEDIDASVEYLYQQGCSELVLLKCTSSYPAPIKDANLRTIEDMKRRFQIPVGLSDHSQGIDVALASVALGANVIERHFVLDRNTEAVDGAFSSTPEEFSRLVGQTKNISAALGKVQYGPSESELDSLKYRRSIYVTQNLEPGAILTAENIKVIRPGYGLAPKFFEEVLGKMVNKAKSANTPLHADDID